MGKRIAFGWYGGKYSHLDFILPYLPRDAVHFCDVFGGSAAVVLNAGPYPVETYNDRDGDVVHFFRTLRDQPLAVLRALEMTPYARAEVGEASGPQPEGLDDVERARRFYVRARQTRNGLGQSSSAGRWGYCVEVSRAGMGGGVSRWLGGMEGLAGVAERLRRVQIECGPALEVLARYDGPGTLFYLDPPYVHSTRGDDRAYRYEMDDGEHRALGEALQGIEGRAVVSGYASALYDELFEGWHHVRDEPRRSNAAGDVREEHLWMNFAPDPQAAGPRAQAELALG